MLSAGSKDVPAYIAAAPAKARPRQLRKIIKDTAPKATETISYGMPYYSYQGRLIYFGLARAWLGLYLLGRAKARYAKELKPYLSGASTARFSLDRPLPTALIRKVVKERVAENEERQKRRRSATAWPSAAFQSSSRRSDRGRRRPDRRSPGSPRSSSGPWRRTG